MGEELFIEIGCEEIPARFLENALADLSRLITGMLTEQELTFGKVRTAGTPRRLVVGIDDVLEGRADKVVEKLGPSRQVAFDANGSPTKAAIGFAKGQGLDVEDLQIVKTDKGEYIGIKKEIPGRDAIEILAEELPRLILALPWPKSMKWGELTQRFVRPVQWIVALFGQEKIDFELFGLRTTNQTRGHRFMSPDKVEVTGFDDYINSLRGSNVFSLVEERKSMIERELERIGKELKATVVDDQWLIGHVSNIVECPVALSGGFDERYLELPREVLVTTMRDHQKYFVVEDKHGALLPRFVTISNMLLPDRSVVVKGNERVLAARLDDARFYYNEDLKKPLDEIGKGLSGVVFQADLGTYAEKTERVRRLAGMLSADLLPKKVDLVDRAALLAKADLVSGMVGEFPELQGIMGMYYAKRHNETDEVALAIAEHYLPKGQGAQLPETETGAMIALADKLDTICGCFGVGLAPTGKGDPFALRRAALGVIHILADRSWRADLPKTLSFALDGVMDKVTAKNAKADKAKLLADILEFFRGRLANWLKGEKLPTKTIDAVLSVRFADLVEVRLRAEAVANFAAGDQFEAFDTAFKRAANILASAKDDFASWQIDEKLFAGDAEKGLFKALGTVEKEVKAKVESGDNLGALSAIASIRPQVDTFFDDVLVMDKDLDVRKNRLALLARLNDLFADIADFKSL